MGCRPALVMRVGKEVDKQRPRFAVPERLLFYELEHDNANIVLRIETIDAYTKDQLVNFPLTILLANKNKQDVRYKMMYHEMLYHDTLQHSTTQPSFKLLKVTKSCEVDITDSIQLAVSSNATHSFYALRIDFPKQLIFSLEEPVMGIVSRVDRKQYDTKYSTRPDNNSKSQSVAKSKDEIIFDDKPDEPILQQPYIIPSINIWFQIQM